MQSIMITYNIYVECFKKALPLCVKNWKVLFSMIAYSVIILFSLIVFGQLSFIGGLFIGIIINACMSSFLFMVENLIKDMQPNMEDFKKGFFVYFWDIVNIGFTVGIPFWIASEVLLRYPNGFIWIIFLRILTYLFFNATPELIYTGSHNTLEIFRRSYRFIVDNWIEWFIPNILFVIPFVLIFFLEIPYLGIVLKPILASFLIYFVMVFRGLLFQELYNTSPHQRLFRYRNNRL